MSTLKYFTLTPDTTPETLKAEYRELVKIHHPDLGGNTADFQDLQAEYQQAIKMLAMRPEYGYITDSETFHNLMGAADDLLERFGFENLAEILTKNAAKLIDSIKLPPTLKYLEDFKPFAKMQIAEKLSDPAKFAADVERFIRDNRKT